MAIADRAAAFLSQMGAKLPEAVTTASGAALERMKASGSQMGQAAGQFLGNVGTATGAVLSGKPDPTTYYGKTNVVASPGGINPGGLLGSVGMKGAAAKLQAAYQDPRTAQMIGAGVMGAGVLGIGAVAGVPAMQYRRNKMRMAGPALGTQLNALMPPQY